MSTDPLWRLTVTRTPTGELVSEEISNWTTHHHPADREVTFADGATLRPLTACRCPRCGKYVAWFYRHPDAGLVLIRRCPSDHDAAYLAAIAASDRHVEPDLDMGFIIPDAANDQNEGPIPAWCANCRAWPHFKIENVRTAIANGTRTIRQ